MGRKSFKAYNKLATVAKDLRQDYTQQRFQSRDNLSSKLANTTYYQLPRHNHLLKRRAFCMLCRIQKNSPQFDPDDVIDLIGEDFDVDEAEDEEDELDEIDVPLEHVINFWNSTINWTNVDLSFTRPGEGERQQRRKSQRFNRSFVRLYAEEIQRSSGDP